MLRSRLPGNDGWALAQGIARRPAGWLAVPADVEKVLAAALTRWRAASSGRLLASELRPATDDRCFIRAHDVATKAAELCLVRGVLPELVGIDFITEVVIPPRPRARESRSTLELSTYSHGPVVVRCEWTCASKLAAIHLVDLAVEASVVDRGWAPIYVRLWRELLHGT